MKHFLLTRWNLPGSLHHSSLELVSDPRWQARRRELFERYCLPSVERQTAPDFTWLLVAFTKIMTQADLEWFRSQDDRLCIITIRLDSDDVLHRDHLRKVRVDYSGHRKVVEFKHGFYYDVMRDKLRHVEEMQNAFVSVLEPAQGARTAWGWPHHKMGEENEILYLDEPGWVALVHDQNTTTYL